MNSYLLYIDPGTGSLFLQILLASVFGALFTVKIFWQKIKALIVKPFRKEIPQNEQD